jgi:hypothetical protein
MMVRSKGWFSEKVNALQLHLEEVAALEEKVKTARVKALASPHTPSWFVFFKYGSKATIVSHALGVPV